MADFDIQGNVVVQTGDAEAALKKLRDKQAADNKQTQTEQLNAASKVGQLAMVAGAAMVGGVVLMTKESATAQTVQLGLAQALRNTGQYSTAAMTHIDSLTNSLRKQTGVSDETQKSALAFASTMRISETNAERLLPLLMDMSSVTGMDLETAFRASAQAMNGNVGMFQRYGVTLKQSANGTVDFNDLIRQLCVYAGSLEQKMSGAEGASIKFKSALAELSEKMGASVLPGLTKTANGLTTLVEKFNDMPAATQAVITQSTLAMGGFLLIGGAIDVAVVGVARFKIAIDTLTAGTGWSALMKLLAGAGGILGLGALPLTIGIAAVKGANSDAWAAERQKLLQAFNPTYGNNYVPPTGGRGTINRGVVSSSNYPSRTWTPANQAGLESVQAGTYTSTPEQVAAMDAIVSANDDLQHKLYDASHTEKQAALHDLDLEVKAYQQAGADKVAIAQYAAAKRAQIEKQYAKDTASWSPINVSGVNVSSLSSYIGSLQGTKVKKQTLELTLKIDGTSIKIEQSALAKLKETLGNLVYAKVMAALGGSPAFGG